MANFGQKNTIVGPSGTGKILITAAFYDIDSGEILIDGKIFMISIRESSWQYSIVPQDVIFWWNH
jgi:ABC-type multidrug transport system fused ATPase/permease subunit